MTDNSPYQEKYYTSVDGLKLYYRDYNNSQSDKPPLLCLHGLTRNSKDFDLFAQHFAPDYRILSLDIRGRGKSAYDPNYTNYQVPTYVQDVLTFLAHEGVEKPIAVGTSMGGLISMALGMVNPDIFKAIILNDVGPEVDPEGIKRISTYVGNAPVLKDWQQAINAVKVINGPMFPDYPSEKWQLFARNTFREQSNGQVIADYDPHIGTALRESVENAVPVDLWPMFEALAPIPVMAIRGEESDILSPETLDKMDSFHPKFTRAIIPNRGHAPDLTEDESLKQIRLFINKL